LNSRSKKIWGNVRNDKGNMKTPRNWTIEGLFEGRLEAYKLFNILREYVESLGPVKIEATKTQVSFGLKTKFAWVWLPQMWIKKQKDSSITCSTSGKIGHI